MLGRREGPRIREGVSLLTRCLTIAESAAKDPSHSPEWMWPILGALDPEAKPGMRLSPIERARVMPFQCEAACLRKGKREIASNPTDPNGSPGIIAVVKTCSPVRVETASRCAGHRLGRLAGRRGREQDGRSKQEQHAVSGDAPSLPRHGWELFFWCLRELAPRFLLSVEAHRAVLQAFNSTPLWRGLTPRGRGLSW